MTLFTLCNDVLGEVGWPTATAIAASTDRTAKQIFGLAKLELRQLCEMFTWPQLVTEYPFDTVVDQEFYALPDDYKELVTNSAFHVDQYYALRGSIDPREWHLKKEGLLGSLSRTNFRVGYVAGVAGIRLVPTPTAVESLLIEYKTNYFAAKADGTLQETFILDTDVPRIPENFIQLGLRWRFRRVKGLDFSAELAEYNSTIQAQFSKTLALSDITIGGRGIPTPITNGYVPDNGFG